MANKQIPLPDKFELGANNGEKWPLHKQRWENYVVVAGYADTQENIKKAVFLHCLGDEALKTYNSMSLPESHEVKDIIKEFDKLMVGEKNITYERFLFNKRKQQDGETFEMFLGDLKKLLKNCEYCSDCNDSLLRDKIVVGINDCNLQKELLKVRKLNLETCIDMCRANENAIIQNQAMKPENVNKIYRSKHDKPVQRKPEYKKFNRCKFCGRKHEFSKSKCPAYGKSCTQCLGKNHFASECKSRANKTSKPSKVYKLEQREEYAYESDSSCEWINKIQHGQLKNTA